MLNKETVILLLDVDSAFSQSLKWCFYSVILFYSLNAFSATADACVQLILIHCVSKNWIIETFYYNFAKIALISIKIGTHNQHVT